MVGHGKLKVYAHPASQPSRAVIWTCLIQQLPIQLFTDPKHVAEVNPRGQMPAIDDDGFVLTEMPAILCYLADKHDWEGLYSSDLQKRAQINAYLHTHHSLTRLATMKLMAPHIHVAFGGSQLGNPLSYLFNASVQASMSNSECLAEGQALVEQVIDHIEEVYLQNHNFVCATDQPSIADIACYEELGQLVPAGLIDVSQRENLSRWIERMQQLPNHDALHTFNSVLGDIKAEPNTMTRFTAAAEASLSELEKLEHMDLC